MQFLELVGSGRTDGGNARSAEVAHIMELAEKIIEERGHTIGAGKNQPIVGIQLEHGVHDVFATSGRLDFDRRNLQHFSAQFAQLMRKLSGLAPGAGHYNSFTKEQTPLKPI